MDLSAQQYVKKKKKARGGGDTGGRGVLGGKEKVEDFRYSIQGRGGSRGKKDRKKKKFKEGNDGEFDKIKRTYLGPTKKGKQKGKSIEYC